MGTCAGGCGCGGTCGRGGPSQTGRCKGTGSGGKKGVEVKVGALGEAPRSGDLSTGSRQVRPLRVNRKAVVGDKEDRLCGVGLAAPGEFIGKGANGSPARAATGGETGELLLPGFSVAVPKDGNWVPSLAESCRKVCVKNGVLLRPESKVPGIDRPRPTGGRAIELLPRITSRISGGGAALGGPGFEELTFVYRTQSFTLPIDWFVNWVQDWAEVYQAGYDAEFGLVGSVNTTINQLWSTFRTERWGRPTDFDGLIGCYDLHRDDWSGAEYFFWTNDWGAPREVLRTTAQLLATYWEQADYTDAASQQACTGLDTFLRDLMRGGEATRKLSTSNDATRCRLTVNHTGRTGFPVVNARCDEAGELECGGVYWDDCTADSWDSFELDWNAERVCYKYAGSQTCGRPPSGCGNVMGTGGNFAITRPAIWLAFDGAVADRIMNLARLCQDYARSLLADNEVFSYAQYHRTADRIARYALGICAESGDTWIHEVGHCYLGESHCGGALNCCFDNAAAAWLCRVRARLGLPRHEFERASVEFETTAYAVSLEACSGCSKDDNEIVYNTKFCNLGLAGSIGQQGVFEGSGCVDCSDISYSPPTDPGFDGPGIDIIPDPGGDDGEDDDDIYYVDGVRITW